MEIIAIIQARMGSTRLPGKVLADICGKPALAIQIERIKMSRKIDRLVIATTTDAGDDPIHNFAKENSIDCYRGSVEDVLDRYYQAARIYALVHICRITADCPLIDPTQIDRLASFYRMNFGKYVYVAPGLSFPDGIASSEFLPFSILKEAWKEATQPDEREHVTRFIRSHNERYPKKIFENEIDLGRYRITLDYPGDLEVIKRVVSELGYGKQANMASITAFLDENQRIQKINKYFQQMRLKDYVS